MDENGVFRKLPQYVLLSFFKLNFPYYSLVPFLLPLPSFKMGKIVFHLVHYISTPIYGVISPLSLLDTRLNMFSSLTTFSRVLFWKHSIIFVAFHWAFPQYVTRQESVSNCITHGRDFQERKKRMLGQYWGLSWPFRPSGVLLSLMDCCEWWSFTFLPPGIKKIKFNKY